MDKSQVLRTVADIDLQGKSILMRVDLDVPTKDGKISDDSRLLMTLPTVEAMMAAEPEKVTIIGHLGRPLKNSDFRFPAFACQSPSGSIRTRLMARSSAGRQISDFSLGSVRKWYEERLTGYKNWELWENLRFDIGEETNSQSFAEEIVRRSSAEVYVFEAFATAHEPHASVISVPKLVPETAVGFRFAEEIRNLTKIWQNPKRPVVFMLGGAKLDTKLPLVEKLSEAGDKVLLGGLFPSQVQSSRLRLPFASRFYPNTAHGALFGGQAKFKSQDYSSKLKIARLRSDGLDITEESARMFADKIMSAGTVVWNGPLGAFEGAELKAQSSKFKVDASIVEEQLRNTPAWGTWVVAKAMRETGAFTVAGGGDTEAALTKLGGSEGIDWISSGGGAMLYYLAHRTLPLLEVLK